MSAAERVETIFERELQRMSYDMEPTPMLGWFRRLRDEILAALVDPELAFYIGGIVVSPPTIHVHRCRSDRDHPAHYYDVDGDVYLCQGLPGQEVVIGTPPVPVEAEPDWLENGP